jgi:hypothetical protein
MRRRSLLVLLSALGLAALPLRAQNPSPEIQSVLKDRLVGKNDLRVDDLPKAKPTPEQLKRLDNKASYERYDVPYPKNMADGFAYAIFRFKDTGEIWIQRTGGFAGVSELYVVPAKPK